MENKFQTSFIPKRPIIAADASIKVKHPLNLFSIVATGVFILALLGTGGIFAYQQYLSGRIESMDQQLVEARASLETGMLNDFMRLDARMNSAREILNKHVAMSLFFDVLQNNTVKTVQFTDFNYTVNEVTGMEVIMRGKAESYNAIALQSSLLSRNRNIKNPSFSDMDLDEFGNVMFTFRAFLDPELISHKNTLNELSYIFNQ